jgi:pilus assembly protein CpaE
VSHPNHLRALSICPGRELSQQFAAAGRQDKFFDVVAELQNYPAAAPLEIRMRQLRPEVLLVDVATDLAVASKLIQQITEALPAVPVVGLHLASDATAILTTLRVGATEFLFAPFDVAAQEAAVTRIRKLTDPTGGTERARGKMVAFTSAKPGSGATTLAVQTARALRKGDRRRVLMVDLNLNGGSAAFCMGVTPAATIEPLLVSGTRIDHGMWSHVVENVDGLDILAAPELPLAAPADAGQVAHVLDHARGLYEWIVLDLPCVFERLTLGCIAEADRAFVVSTPDLASLHMTRRAVKMLRQFGFDASRFGVLLNRMEDRSDLTSAELKKLFDCDVDRGLPSDPSNVGESLLRGVPLAGGAFGKAVEGLATKLMTVFGEAAEGAPAATGRSSRAVWSGA